MAKNKNNKNTKKTNHKKISRVHRKMGKAPGAITYLGAREGGERTVNIIEYDENIFNIYTPQTVEEIKSHKDSPSISWINIVGISDELFIEELGNQFKLNPLILEDAVNTQQRPKIDEYETYIFGVFKMLYLNEQNDLVNEHIAIVLMDKTVFVFQELKDDVFNGVRERIKSKSGRIRYRGADYLFFILLDSIIDNYFAVLENINNNIETLEEEVYRDPTPEVAHKIQILKKEVLKIRGWIHPVKELVNRLIDSENQLITKDTKLFLRDAMDHCIEINDSLLIYREMTMSLMEMYMSNISNKMNEVMKVLTIMASIFIPLTFIAGIYGMNFEHMPELHWEYGYYAIWGFMFLIFIVLLIFFKKRKWI